MKTYFRTFFILFPFSFLIFYGLYSSLIALKYKPSINQKKEAGVHISEDVMLYNKLLTECFEKYNYDVLIDCEKKVKEANNKKEVENKKEGTNYLIYIIYLLMILALNTQLSIFVDSYMQKEKLNEVFFHLSDWAINSPPMLGVLGTIISFALLVGTMKEGNIQDIFTKSFFDAAITTIIGGLIYVFNLLLKVKIYTRIK